jgi:cob(I)alamin adenosyltransferase
MKTKTTVRKINLKHFPFDYSQVDDLREIQHRLFDLGGELSIPEYVIIDKSDVDNLEKNIDYYNENLEPLKDFIIPGGSISSGQVHICRTLTREAEIQLIECQQIEKNVNENALKYLNRLSDYFFVLARLILFNENKTEVLWETKKTDPK